MSRAPRCRPEAIESQAHANRRQLAHPGDCHAGRRTAGQFFDGHPAWHGAVPHADDRRCANVARSVFDRDGVAEHLLGSGLAVSRHAGRSPWRRSRDRADLRAVCVRSVGNGAFELPADPRADGRCHHRHRPGRLHRRGGIRGDRAQHAAGATPAGAGHFRCARRLRAVLPDTAAAMADRRFRLAHFACHRRVPDAGGGAGRHRPDRARARAPRGGRRSIGAGVDPRGTGRAQFHPVVPRVLRLWHPGGVHRGAPAVLPAGRRHERQYRGDRAGADRDRQHFRHLLVGNAGRTPAAPLSVVDDLSAACDRDRGIRRGALVAALGLCIFAGHRQPVAGHGAADQWSGGAYFRRQLPVDAGRRGVPEPSARRLSRRLDGWFHV